MTARTDREAREDATTAQALTNRLHEQAAQHERRTAEIAHAAHLLALAEARDAHRALTGHITREDLIDPATGHPAREVRDANGWWSVKDLESDHVVVWNGGKTRRIAIRALSGVRS